MSKKLKYFFIGLIAVIICAISTFIMLSGKISGITLIILLAIIALSGYIAVAFIISSFTKKPRKTLKWFINIVDLVNVLPY